MQGKRGTVMSLEQTLTATEPDEIKLDRSVKRILADKNILARILKETVEECCEMSYDEIRQCIEGNVDIEQIPVNPGLTNTIRGNATEDAVPGEGCVYYDIRTYLWIPGTESCGIKILLNIEAQKNDTPGYDVSERAIYYGCRMISAQLGTEFTNHSDDPVKYRNIKKVYSIWLCTESAETRANRIVRYRLNRELLFAPDGTDTEDGNRYDLMQIAMIYISKKHTGHDSENPLIRMLTDLFNEEVEAQEKIRLLEKKHQLPMSDATKKEVVTMCKYTAVIEEKGLEKGRKEGRAEGRKEGQTILVKAVERLKEGATVSQLLASGIDQQTIDSAMLIRNLQ